MPAMTGNAKKRFYDQHKITAAVSRKKQRNQGSQQEVDYDDALRRSDNNATTTTSRRGSVSVVVHQTDDLSSDDGGSSQDGSSSRGSNNIAIVTGSSGSDSRGGGTSNDGYGHWGSSSSNNSSSEDELGSDSIDWRGGKNSAASALMGLSKKTMETKESGQDLPRQHTLSADAVASSTLTGVLSSRMQDKGDSSRIELSPTEHAFGFSSAHDLAAASSVQALAQEGMPTTSIPSETAFLLPHQQRLSSLLIAPPPLAPPLPSVDIASQVQMLLAQGSLSGLSLPLLSLPMTNLRQQQDLLLFRHSQEARMAMIETQLRHRSQQKQLSESLLLGNQLRRQQQETATTRSPPSPRIQEGTDLPASLLARSRPSIESPDSPQPSVLLSLPSDQDVLSEYQILVRQHMEFFVAEHQDVHQSLPGRKVGIFKGQVGIRCIHCRDLRVHCREAATVFFPTKFHRIYNCAQNIAMTHFARTCPNISDSLRESFVRLRDHKQKAGFGKSYWAHSAKTLGIVETEHGLSFQKQQSQITTLSPPLPLTRQEVVDLPLEEPGFPANQLARYRPKESSTTTTIIPMSLPSDRDVMSEYQILIRQHMEYFVAEHQDLHQSLPGRKVGIFKGQVGIRCIHCRDLRVHCREAATVFFPTKFHRIYHSAQNIAMTHFARTCPKISDSLRESFIRLRDHKQKGGVGKSYWAHSAQALGIVETENGLSLQQKQQEVTSPTASAYCSLAAED